MNIKIFSALLIITVLQTSPVAAQNDITLNIKNGDIKDVLHAIASISDKSIITDSSVSGNISIAFKNIPLTDALNLITASKGLTYRNINDVIVVASADNLKNYNNSIISIPLSYTYAKDVIETLKTLFPDSKIGFDTASNTILFSGSAIEEERLRSSISAIDIPTKQITLEAKIISVNQEAAKNLGISWTWDTLPQKDTDTAKDTGNTDSSDYGGSFKFWRGYAFKFNAALNALFADGKAKILATPRIITIPGKEASIFIGDHIPVQTEKHDSGSSYTSTEYIDAGINLTYTPIVSQDGRMVTAAVHTEVSTPTLISELQNYKVSSRTADTNVRMLSGETLVIGGLINEEEQKSIQKIPLLSNIPILGELFKNRSSRKNKTEVLIILTPYITEAGYSPAIYDNLDTAPAEQKKKDRK